MQDILAFLALLLPLTLSPGPATIALAGLAMNKGIFHSLPFYFGLVISSFIIIIASGMGLNEIFLTNPVVYKTIRFAGILYIFYLALKFIGVKPSSFQIKGSEYKLYDGMLLTALNPKFYVMVTVTFSQFLKPEQNSVWILTFGFVSVITISLFVWLAIGASLKSLLKSEKALRIQSVIFGLLLLSVALFMLLQGS
ncbi:LysE family translocator [Caldithrix abyssi]|nr:LysE family translocator [Caldithrix abyssi]